jgi:hypothetical protein
LAQQLAFNAPSDESAPAAASSVVKPSAPASVTTAAWEPKVDRWLDLNTMSYSARYRSTFDNLGSRSFEQGQQRIIADGKFKFDEQGRYGVGFHLSSGRYFNWAFADFIGGGQHEFITRIEKKMSPTQVGFLGQIPYPKGFFNSGGGQVYLRQLFLTAEPVNGIEAQFGGIAINHGVNTEATSYDDDGYMVGERITVKRPKQLWLSEVSYTRGYVGDLYTPNFFARGQHLAVTNYSQYLFRKDFGKRISVSTDYTISAPEGLTKIKTTREAIFANVHESKVLDGVRFEAYQRINGANIAGSTFAGSGFVAGKGYALTLTRRLSTHGSVDAGLVNIDGMSLVYLGANPQAAVLGLGLNGDQYGLGNRFFVRPTIVLTKSVSLVGYFTHTYNYTPTDAFVDIWNKQALNVGFVVDAKKLFFPHKIG